MKNKVFLTILSALIFSLVAFSQSSDMFSYSIYSVLKGDDQSEKLLTNIVVIQGYTFNFESKGNVEANFKITPLNNLGEKVRTKIVIDSANTNFEDTVDLSKNQKNYVASIYYLKNGEENVLDIYIQVNDVEKLEFKEETLPNNENSSVLVGFYYNILPYYNNPFVPRIFLDFNNLLFFELSNFFSPDNVGFNFGVIFKDLKAGINVVLNDNFYIFLEDMTSIDTFDFHGLFVPFSFDNNNIKFQGDFMFEAIKNFNNIFFGLGTSYFQNQYDFLFKTGIASEIDKFDFEANLGYKIISKVPLFSINVSYEF